MAAQTSAVSLVVLALLVLASIASAFTIAPTARTAAVASRQRIAARTSVTALRMSNEVEEKEEDGIRSIVTPEAEEETTGEQSAPEFGQKGFFMPNENMRFGTSRDQDGKSNVWAVEPKMKVDDGENKGAALAAGGAILAVCVALVAVTISQLPGVDAY